MSSPLLQTLTFLLFALGVVLWFRGWRRQKRLVRDWAALRGVTLVKKLPAWFRSSPFPLALFAKQRVEYWIVRDQSGKERRVWLNLGNFAFGSRLDAVKEEWER